MPLNNAQLRACCAMEAEPYTIEGFGTKPSLAAEEALPAAWEIGEWDVVFFSSGLAGDRLLEAGTAGQSTARPRSCLQ